MEQVIRNFYEAFDRLDAEGMAACYHKEVVFEDPAFGVLKGQRAGDMWRMLCESQKGKDFRIEYSDIQYDGKTGTAHWEAYYEFSKTARKVHNKIDATFQFKDGLIIHHKDHFNLKNWAKQAMGFQGALLGGLGFFKKKLQAQTNSLLDKYRKKP
ncbi:MAG: nuclear transport factor 2 family protein [Cyclobacteriaceae bacterium]